MSDSEFVIQSHVSTMLRRIGILHHGDQNAGRRSMGAGARAKATGMCKGWPDMVIVEGGTVMWIEFKTIDGRLSSDQRKVSQRLRGQGQKTYVVQTSTKEEAWTEVRKILGMASGKEEK